MLQNAYMKRVYDQVIARDPDQKEFHQAVLEVLESLEPVIERHPEYEEAALMERFVEPERMIGFRRSGQSPRQPGLPGTVQLRHRPLQGRSALPSHGESVHPEVPGL